MDRLSNVDGSSCDREFVKTDILVRVTSDDVQNPSDSFLRRVDSGKLAALRSRKRGRHCRDLNPIPRSKNHIRERRETRYRCPRIIPNTPIAVRESYVARRENRILPCGPKRLTDDRS